ncbi:MAG: O-antigen ligase family protein [Candidatus Omnitrophota bacterium]
MVLIFLLAIFIRPFISTLAFPVLDLIYSTGLLIFLVTCLIYKKIKFLIPRVLFAPVILFIFALLVSVIFSQNKINSLEQLPKYIIAVLLFLVASVLSEKEKKLTVQTIVWSGLVVSLLAIYQYYFGFQHVLNYLLNNKFSLPFALDYLQSKRVFAPFVTPGILGGYLAMVIPLFLINKKLVWLVLPVFFALWLTMSLGAFLSLFFTGVLFFCIKGEFKWRYASSFMGLLIAIIIIFILRSQVSREHVHPVFSASMRLNYWKETLEIIKAHPLVGIGLGNFNLILSRYAHNSYLQFWAETGLLGLCPFLWIVFIIIKFNLKNLKQLFYNNQTTCLLASSIIFLVHNFSDFTFFLPEVAFIWWVILGLIIA